MLGSLGDIRTPQEVVRVIRYIYIKSYTLLRIPEKGFFDQYNVTILLPFFSLMRDAEKLMSRCIYLNILKATISAAKENRTSSETLEK